jgi:hypothetical protein
MNRPISAATIMLLIAVQGCGPKTSSPEPPATRSATWTRPTSTMGVPSMAEVESDWTSTSEGWVFMGVQGRLAETPNFEIYTTLGNERLQNYLPTFYETVLGEYMTRFGELPPPPKPMTSYIFGDQRQWKNKTRMLLPEMSSSFESLGRGGFTLNGTAVLYDIDKYQWDRDTLALAAHEGWHQYAQVTFEHQLPPWLDEALATNFEGFRFRRGELYFSPSLNRERRYRLREAIRTDMLIPLPELIGRDPHQALAESKEALLTFYAQVWALGRFLTEAEDGRYRDALENVLLLNAQGDLYRQLLRQARRDGTPVGRDEMTGQRLIETFFNEDFEEFTTSYDAWVMELARSRG